MAKAISQDSRVSITKTMLGLCSKVIYLPTGSSIKVFKAECSIETGRQMERIIKSTDATFDQVVTAADKFKEATLGNYLLEALVSADHEFVALRLYRFADLKYSPITSLTVFEGRKAKKVGKLFC